MGAYSADHTSVCCIQDFRNFFFFIVLQGSVVYLDCYVDLQKNTNCRGLLVVAKSGCPKPNLTYHFKDLQALLLNAGSCF